MAKTSPLVIGVFQQESNAKGALKTLKDAGFEKDQIGFALREGSTVTHSLLHELVTLGVPEDRSTYYESEYKSGRPIIFVRADGREQEATSILQQYGAYDQGAYQSAAARTTANMAVGTTVAGETMTDQLTDESRSLHLRAERLNVDKRHIPSGEVRLHKEVVKEHLAVDVAAIHEEVFIRRHIIDDGRLSDTPIGLDETIRIPVLGEQVTVTKTPVETGEVVVGKRAVQENQRVTDTVRHEEARLEKQGDPRVHVDEDLLHP